jgi:transposase
MTSPQSPAVFGCDVGKREIVVHDWNGATTHTLPNQAQALAAFAASLPNNAFVVCEATGGYETVLLEALAHAGRQAHRADPRKAKAFIRSFGALAKTDALDARALARYGCERHATLERWRIPDAARQRLQALIMARADLVAHRTALNNRLKAPGVAAIAGLLKPLADGLKAALHAIEADIQRIIRANKPLACDARTLAGIPSIGPLTAASLIALMPELGSLNRKTAAALAGLAPHPNQSGAKDGYRRTKGGRPQVKRTLFMAALTAARHHPSLKDFYNRLIANGKKPILALTAIMRKLIVIANATLKHAHAQKVS